MPTSASSTFLPSATLNSAVRYRRAAADLAQAIALTRDTERSRKAFFLSTKGFILARLGEKDQAVEAYRQAVALEEDPVTRAGYEQERTRLDQAVSAP